MKRVATPQKKEDSLQIAQNGPTGWIFFPLVTADESVERVRRVFAFDKETVRFAELCRDQTYFGI